jgi:hypothetical protein
VIVDSLVLMSQGGRSLEESGRKWP